MNKLTIIGNLTRDPELRTTSAGVNVCDFTVAVNRRKTGDKQPETDFFRVSAWRQMGENCAKFLEKGRKVCVVFDEFQDILDVKDGEQLLALMRSRIQFMSRTSFVFLGSARNAMMDIFMSPRSPFYKSATVFDVGTIPDDDFYDFAKARFATGKRRLPRALFDRILDFVGRTTGDVQEMCDAIWQESEPGDLLEDAHFEKGLQFVFSRENSAYCTFLKPVTDIQLRVLRALAVKGGAHPLSNEFLEEARLTNTATVRRSLASLENTGLVYPGASGWKFVSPFFCEWMRRMR